MDTALKDKDHLLLHPLAHYQSANSELEKLELGPVTTHDAGMADSSLTHCTTVLAPNPLPFDCTALLTLGQCNIQSDTQEYLEHPKPELTALRSSLQTGQASTQ